MIFVLFAWYFITLCMFNVYAQSKIIPASSRLTSSDNKKPSITQLLVFSPSSETTILFEPKHGWMINEEKKLRLFISGSNLKNNSLVFSTSSTHCTPLDFVSPVYRLSSEEIIELNVKLKPPTKAHLTVYICLLPASRGRLNRNLTRNGTILSGPYYTFIREKGGIPFPVKVGLILMLFTVSGFFSGLNLGLMSLSVNDLCLIAESKDASMSYYAKRVLPLRKRGNHLLCSIVISNVLVNSLGTVLLDSLVHGLFAVIGATVMIVLMGEIIPQAICSRYGLVIGARTHLITWTAMFITGPISYPLGLILNKILGQEVTASYTRDQIAGMLTRVTADIEKPELDVITGVLALRKKTVKDAMTWLPDVYALSHDRKTDTELLLEIYKHGFSRIPVYANEKSNILGIVKLRDFALITPEQYHLTVKHILEFHTHAYGYTKINDSLYDLLQEFLKARWHIALVQEERTEEGSLHPVTTNVGLITLEDVIEEMLQREIIEETDLFTDNRSKIQRKKAKTMDYTALVKRPVKGPSISPQLKVAVFQFLSTNVQQFTSGFISQEILKVLLNYNLYATIKRPDNQTTKSIYLYKKHFHYELFTLIIQGNATLESGIEKIKSTVGPFSYFASSALLANGKTVKDVHRFLDRLCTSNDITNILDEITSVFISDYDLIVTSELHVLQIHRLVWLAAVRATQQQRGNDPQLKRMQPDQLLSNALDEISSVTNVPMDKNNLTNFQQIFQNEKEVKRHFEQVENGEPVSPDFTAGNTLNIPDETNFDTSSNRRIRSTSNVAFNPLVLSISSTEHSNGNVAKMGTCNTSSASTSLNEGVFNSNMNINQMFKEAQDQTINDDHGHENEHLIDQGQLEKHIAQRQVAASNVPRTRSDTNILNNSSVPEQALFVNNTNESTERPRRARSMLGETNCVPS